MGEALANAAFQQRISAVGIVIAESNAVAVAEIELGQITVQVLLVAVLVNAAHPALVDREHALNGVAVHGRIFLADVLPSAVQGGPVVRKLFAQLAVHTGFVGHKPRFLGNVGANDGVNFFGPESAKRKGANLPAVTIYQRQHGHPVCAARAGLGNTCAPPNIGFIDLDSATVGAKRGHIAWLRGCGAI